MSDDEFKNLKTPQVVLVVKSAIPHVRYCLGSLDSLFEEFMQGPNEELGGEVSDFVDWLNKKAIERDVQTLTEVK